MYRPHRQNLLLRLFSVCLRFYLFIALAFVVLSLVIATLAGPNLAFNLLSIVTPTMLKIGLVLLAEVVLAIALESLSW